MQDQDMTIRCSRCGTRNRLPRMHCEKCGEKLDFEATERDLRRGGGRGHLLTWVKSAVAAAMAAGILLAIWPGTMDRSSGEAVDAKRYRLKSELLVDALERGMPASLAIEEKELNAFLDELVAAQPPREGWSPVLEDIAVRMSPGQADVFVMVGRGPLTLTARFVARTQGAELMIVQATAGHLPLPGMLARLYARTQARLLAQLPNESRILRNLDGVLLGEGKIEVLIK